MPVEEAEEESPDEVPLTKINIVDYGSDDDYDDAKQRGASQKEQELQRAPSGN